VKENQYICSGCDKKKKSEILQCSACNEKIFDEKKIAKKEDGLILCTLCMRGSIIE
jgi:formylmethanofuran dehydrogenase subunit E